MVTAEETDDLSEMALKKKKTCLNDLDLFFLSNGLGETGFTSDRLYVSTNHINIQLSQL